MQSPRGLSALAVTLSLALSAAAIGQSLVVQHGQVLAATGAPIPGVAGATFGGTSTFDSTSIDASGRVIFRGRMVGGGSSTLNDRAIFVGYGAADLSMLVRGGDPAFGLPSGYTFNTATLQGLGGAPRISDNATILFSSAVTGPGVLTTNDSALFSGPLGSINLFVREGDPAPGTVGASLSSSFANLSHQPTGVIDSGRVLFQSATLGGDTVTANNAGWFSGPLGAIELVQRKGDMVLGGAVISALGFVSQMTPSGQVLHDETLSQTLGTSPALPANDRTLWRWTPGLGNELVVREGDAAPGTASATFNLPSNSWFVNVSANCFNALGRCLMNADLANGDVTLGGNDRGLYVGDPSGLTLYMRRGDPAPGLPGFTVDAVSNVTMCINNNNDITFASTLLGPGVTTANDTALFVGQPGNWTLIAREGDPAPGTLGATLGNISSQQVNLNDKKQVLATIDTFGGDTVPATNQFAIFGYDPVQGLRLVIRGNDALEVFPGTTRNIGTFGGVQFNNGNGAALSFNHDGDFVFRVTMMDTTGAIVRGRLGSLVGYPEQISASAGGVQRLHMDACPVSAGFTYLVAGSATGSTPGFPVGPFLVPLNIDDYFNFTISLPNTFPLGNTLGALDVNGRSSAPTLTVPAGVGILAGLTLNHAFVAIDMFTNPTFVSEAAPLILLP